MSAALPKYFLDNPFLGSWLRFDLAARKADVLSGKVEIGQGATTAIAQLAAHELGLPLSDVRIIAGDTSRSPNEGLTAGSQSIENGGVAMRRACAEVRELLKQAGAKALAVTSDRVDIVAGSFTVDGATSAITCWDVAGEVDLSRRIAGDAPLRAPHEAGLIGKSAPRVDLPAKLTGSAFIQDLEFPGMLHGRVVRAPSCGAELISVDDREVRARPGTVAVVRCGSFLAVVTETEEGAAIASKRLETSAQWNETAQLPAGSCTADWMKQWSHVDTTIKVAGAQLEAASGAGKSIAATYSRPALAHASIGPSCAIAWLREGKMTVWTHSQGVFSLQAEIARVLKMPSGALILVHAQGAGCYGHNGADDAALDAALLAQALPGRPVRVQWSREDEMTCSPFGSPMMIGIAAVLGQRRIKSWKIDIWSAQHTERPGVGGAPNLLAATQLDPPWPASKPVDVPMEAGGGGLRNAIALYEFPEHVVVHHFVNARPLRLSALRSLGSYANLYAIESFMDEAAASVGEDPVQFRLDHLGDPRARAVIEVAAQMAGWDFRVEPVGQGRAKGLGFGRYKNKAAYTAIFAEVEVDEAVVVRKVWCAVDAGLVVNPDGLINQIEGGIIQAISWTLKEAVRFDEGRIISRTWDDYPILGFDEVPEIAVRLVGGSSGSPLGAGEVAAGPTAAAIANASARALGFRMRDLPISRERIIEAATSETAG